MQLSSKILLLTVTVAAASCAVGVGDTPDNPGAVGSNNNMGGAGSSGGGGTAVSTIDVDNSGNRVSDPGSGPTCGMKTFGISKVPPDLLIVLDKSGSMNETPDGMLCITAGLSCGASAKWPQMTTAINQVVMETDSEIRWGLKLFPDDLDCGVGMNPEVPIADKNGATVSSLLSLTSPSGGTPTRIALTGAMTYLASLTDTNPKYILLATDGMPNCAPGSTSNNGGGSMVQNSTINGVSIGSSSGGSDADDSQATIQTVTDSAMSGIPVFVVGVGSVPDAETTLTAMAIAGGRPQAAAPRYYPVANTADLASVLSDNGATIGSSSFGLGSEPPAPDNIRITANGAKVPQDPTHTNGWDYGTGMTSIQLFGKWCDEAKSGSLNDVNSLLGCPGLMVQ